MDPIDRQTAIDAVEDWFFNTTDLRQPAEVIHCLPSTQPEPITVYIDHELTQEEYEKLRKDVANAPIMLLPSEQPKQRWIPARERLPENDDWVIVTIFDERGDTPFRYTDFGWYLEKANCWIVDAEQRNDVVAWMPLPEPYTEVNNGN